MLISKEELDSSGSRDLIPLECYQCKKTHYRTKNIVLSILNGGKGTRGKYCSKECRGKAKQIPKIKCHCKQCNAEIKRFPSEINGNIFCSTSCSAKYNNHNRMINYYKSDPNITIRQCSEKNVILKKCKCCNKDFSPSRKSTQKYCSQLCSAKHIRQQLYEKISNGEVNGHSANTMRNYLISTRGCRCEICQLTEWRGHPLTVIMDHINGNSNDNSLSNLSQFQ